MNRQQDVDRLLESWMQEGPRVLPDHVLGQALDRVEVTRQRPMALLFDRLLPGVGTGATMPAWASVVAVAAAAVLVAVLFAGLVRQNVADDRESPPPSATAPSPSGSVPPSFDPRRADLEPEAVIPVPDALIAVAHEEEVWVSSRFSVVVIDPATNETRQIDVPTPPGQWAGLTFAEGDLWVGHYGNGTVYRIDTVSGEVIAEIDVGPEAVALTATPAGVWLRTEGRVTWQAERIDPATNEVVATADGGNDIHYGHESLWYSQRGGDRILRADPVTGEVSEVIEVPRRDSCRAIPAGDYVWASCFHEIQQAGSVTQIDPDDNQVTASIDLTGMPTGGTFEAGGLVWLTTLSPDGGRSRLSTRRPVPSSASCGSARASTRTTRPSSADRYGSPTMERARSIGSRWTRSPLPDRVVRRKLKGFQRAGLLYATDPRTHRWAG